MGLKTGLRGVRRNSEANLISAFSIVTPRQPFRPDVIRHEAWLWSFGGPDLIRRHPDQHR